MDLAAGREDLPLVLFEIEIQMGQRVVLDVAGGVPQLLELRQSRHRRGATRDEAGTAAGERLLQAAIAQSAMGVFLERVGGGGQHGHRLLILGL